MNPTSSTPQTAQAQTAAPQPTPFQRLLRRHFENGAEISRPQEAYRLSGDTKNPQGDSGFSVGFVQLDLSTLPRNNRNDRRLPLILQTIFNHSQLKGQERRLRPLLISKIRTLTPADRLFVDNNRAAINAALSKPAAKQLLDRLSFDVTAKLERDVKALIAVADPRAKAFLSSDLGKVAVADFINQFGPPNKLKSFVQGGRASLQGGPQQLRPGQTLDFNRWLAYVGATGQFRKNPNQMGNRLTSALKTLGAAGLISPAQKAGHERSLNNAVSALKAGRPIGPAPNIQTPFRMGPDGADEDAGVELAFDPKLLSSENEEMLRGRLGFHAVEALDDARKAARFNQCFEDCFVEAPGFKGLAAPLERQLAGVAAALNPKTALDLVAEALPGAVSQPAPPRRRPGAPRRRPAPPRLNPDGREAMNAIARAGGLGPLQRELGVGAVREAARGVAERFRIPRDVSRTAASALAPFGGPARAIQIPARAANRVNGARDLDASARAEDPFGRETSAAVNLAIDFVGPDKFAGAVDDELESVFL